MRRRQYIGGMLLGAGGLPGCFDSDTAAPTNDTVQDNAGNQRTDPPDEDNATSQQSQDGDVILKQVVSNLAQPVGFAAISGQNIRYIVDRPGQIWIHDENGLREEPLLDISESVVTSESWEQGLLGIALHPEVPDDPRLYYRFSAPRREGTPSEYTHTTAIQEVEVTEDFDEVRPDSFRVVMEIPQPGPVHNAGDILFGPAGFLYITTGDGGGGYNDNGPGHASDWYTGNEGGNGQDTQESVLGGILRIDVDSTPTESPRTDSDPPVQPGGPAGYAVPADNPLVDQDGHRDEYFAWGFRNPWQATFHGDQLIVAEVGGNWREINVVERGGNYGWNVNDGSHCFDTANPSTPMGDCPEETPEDVREGERLIDPVAEYEHPGESSAIIGGHVYEGQEIPALTNRYVFSDLRPVQFNGLFAATPSGTDGPWGMNTIGVANEILNDEFFVYAFGVDGESIYLLGGDFWDQDGGLYRIQAA